MRRCRSGTPRSPRRSASHARVSPIRGSITGFAAFRGAGSSWAEPWAGSWSVVAVMAPHIMRRAGNAKARKCQVQRRWPEGERFLAAALLGEAVEGVGAAAQGVGVARIGAAGGPPLDLHGASGLQGLDELGLVLGLLDKGALVLGEELEIVVADGHGDLAARREGIAHLHADLAGDLIGRIVRDVEVDRAPAHVLGRG